jgi:osmotically inducible lipoprotein OsmB
MKKKDSKKNQGGKMVNNGNIRVRYFAASLFLSSCLTLSACTEPGETTGVAAATGGVIGAGLGAIVGSQTGSAGAGLVIGAAAGSASGALIGNALEAQEQGIRAQDEAIERQERTIAAQRVELEELRRMNQDSPKARLKSNLEYNADIDRQSANNRAINDRSVKDKIVNDKPVAISRNMQKSPQERDLTVPTVKTSKSLVESKNIESKSGSYSESLYGSYSGRNDFRSDKLHNSGAKTKVEDIRESDEVGAETVEPQRIEEAEINDVAENKANRSVKNSNVSTECRQAQDEVNKAKSSNEAADRLFHYRRAIRLCPTDADLHNGLGEVYVKLKRQDDARFEFKEALTINSEHELAKKNLESLTTGSLNENTNRY